ncbi:MAG: hypothetical protein K2K04_00385, partial [Clostridia bacterium]|nr:hypothetical protein [Clostridia bacterium]
MRKLTVIRKKAFASMFDKTWFYIEDANGNKSIDGVRCKLLCELKNGKSATCEISEEQLKLFAVSGDFKGIDSENGYAADDIEIAAGAADVTVSGKRYV